jgi:hypothetical protein
MSHEAPTIMDSETLQHSFNKELNILPNVGPNELSLVFPLRAKPINEVPNHLLSFSNFKSFKSFQAISSFVLI